MPHSLWRLLVVCSFCLSSFAQSNNAITSGKFIVEPPTLLNLGFEWKIKGDDNRNAAVTVQYRQVGITNW